MEKITHLQLVTALAKPGAAIRDTLVNPVTEHSMRNSIALVTAMELSRAVNKLVDARLGDITFNLPTSDHACHELHMLVGMVGEVGELIDCLKKPVIYGKPLDMENLMEEIGDFLFYYVGFFSVERDLMTSGLAALAELIYDTFVRILSQFEIVRYQVEDANIAKLRKRYESLTYSDQAAIARADKVVETTETPVAESTVAEPEAPVENPVKTVEN